MVVMEHDYKNIISHIDIDRSLGAIEHLSFNGIEDENTLEFKNDIEAGNDSIELHLVKSKSYKEALVLRLKKSNGAYSDAWRDFLREEQKTFGGSKIFYMDNECGKLLVLSLPNEIRNKLNMVITRLNKINDRITRINAKIKKENFDIYSSRLKNKEAFDKKKDDIINFINQNLRV
ncbi:hypothetical protein HYY71_00175 [Candidatus Woesearchaeota archaeon]|nr:hypothetical protein [Candidatus Woesearchaeota archaeon]